MSLSHTSSVYFRANTKSRFYGRDPYKLLELLGDLGALLSVVAIFGALLTQKYVNNSYQRSLLSKTYQV